MGGDLPQKAGKEPTFIVWAVKDPDDGNLDRIQIIKGWTKSGQIFEKVYDVAWSGNRKPDPVTGKLPAVGNTVDVKTHDLYQQHRCGRAQESVAGSGV